MSRCLTERSIDHVVVERGEVAHSWRTERWDLLRLLTPNWQSRLPGFGYEGDDPDGYRTMPEVVDFLDRYASVISAPVQTHTNVKSVSATDGGFLVVSDKGEWPCRTVVLATGACNVARVPAVAAALPGGIATLTSMEYRNPGQLQQGGVLVVGASATGTPARRRNPSLWPPGDPCRGRARASASALPRQGHSMVDGRYRHSDQRYDEVDDIDRARRVPSFS